MRLRTLFLGSVLSVWPIYGQTPGPVIRIDPVRVADQIQAADAAGVTQLDLENSVPAASQTLATAVPRLAGLALHDGGAGSFSSILTLRGLANTLYFSDPAVSLSCDDIPLGQAFTYPTQLVSFGSLSLRRGAQGSSLGIGGEAGALILRTPEPTGSARGELRLSAGEHDQRGLTLHATTGRHARSDATFTASSMQRSGYLYNSTLRRTVDDRDQTVVSGRLRLRPVEALELTLQLLGLRQRDGAQPLVPLQGSVDQIALAKAGISNTGFFGAALKASWNIPGGIFTTTTSRTEWRLSPYENQVLLPPALDSRLHRFQHAWNQELRADSAPKSIIVWHSGLWFSRCATNGETDREIPGFYPAESATFDLNSRTAAWFSEVTLPADLGWTVTLGLRAETVQRDFERRQRLPTVTRFAARRSFDSLQPKLSTTYALTNDTNASAALTWSGRPGGWSAYTANPALAPYGAEHTTAFETGLDTRFDDRNATLAARAFVVDIHGYQIERSFTPSEYLVANAARARSLGVELEGNWRATRTLTLTATLAATNVTLRHFVEPLTSRDLSGHRAPFTPRWTGLLAAQQQLPHGFFMAADLAAAGSTTFDERGDPAFTTKSYATTAASVGWNQRTWRVVARGDNLGNDRHATLVIAGVRHAVANAPRRFTFEITRCW